MSPAEIVDLRRRAEAAEAELARLRQEERCRRAILESAIDLAIVATDRDGRVIDWNAGAERILGWSRAEMLGQPLDRVYTPEDRAAGTEAEERRAAREQGRASNDRWHLRRDGDRLRISGETVPLRDTQGAELGFLKTLRDTTREHGAMEALRAAEARLRESEDHFRHTVELNPQVPWTCDPAGNITSYSNRWLTLTGQAPGEPLGAGWAKAVHPDDLSHTLAVFGASLGSGEPVDVDYRIRVPAAGAYRWMRARAYPRRDEAGTILRWYGVVEDIDDRRRVEAALRLSEERYRTLFETIEAGFCIARMRFDRDGRAVDYLIEEANPAFARQTGAEVAGRWVSTFAPNLERHWFDIYGRVSLTGEPAHFENYAAVFGRWFDVRALRVGAPDERRIAIYFTDITARKQAELRAAANERELRLIADALPVLIAFVDTDRVYRFANEAYRDWFGIGPEAVVGRSLHALLGAAGYAARRPWIERALSGEAVRFELDWPRRDGRPRAAEIRYLPRPGAEGGIDGFHVFVQDVTDRKRAETLLRSRNEALEAEVAARTAERDMIWRASTDLLGVAGLDGHLLSLNPAWSAVLGWSEEALKARPFLDFVHPDDRAATEAAAAGLARGEAQLAFENRCRHRHGSYRWLSWNAVPRDGLVYATARDVTAAREQAAALAATEDALRQSQKMEAVGQLTGGLAHDFNNMLAGVVGALELMQARLMQGRVSELERYIATAQGAAKRAAALTHRLLAFSRRQTLDPKPIDVSRLVEGMAELVRRTVGPAIAVDAAGAAGLWPTLADPSQLENALLNLCINARDAMPEGGRIVIETGNRRLDRHAARERDLEAGDYVTLCVSDDGTGMSPEVAEKAFDPFFTTKPTGQGTGLGLSMVYGFVRQSGGQVRIESALGAGTTVCLYLPRHLGAVEVPEPDGDPDASTRARAGETVLIVDDEPTVRMLVSEVLEDLGYAAIEAADGAAGLKVLQSDVRIDLLVTDVGLPGGMNGRQMADAALLTRPGLKVLFITGYAENAALNHGHLAHGMQVMTKPFAMDTLAARIRGLIEGR